MQFFQFAIRNKFGRDFASQDVPADVVVFHAGTARAEHGWTLMGGRGAYVTATGVDVEAARVRAYECVGGIGGAGWRCRRDVGEAVAPAGGGRHRDGE